MLLIGLGIVVVFIIFGVICSMIVGKNSDDFDE